MLKLASDLMGVPVRATDGEIGSVSRMLLDDERWAVRYVVADTGKWLPGRKVLLSPVSFRRGGWGPEGLAVSLTRQQVKDSPDIDTDQPVSRRQEMRHYGYYRYPYYWGGTGLWGAAMYPYELGAVQFPPQGGPEDADLEDDGDSHLRDSKEISGYRIRATDGELGHVDDFLVDDETWSVRYLVVDTEDGIDTRRVLIAPEWVTSVSWSGATVDVALTREAVNHSPPYDPGQPLGRGYEQHLYAHHGRRGYWDDATPVVSGQGGVRPLESVRPDLARLEEWTDLQVASGDPDVRGWKVVGSDARPIGVVEHLIVDRSDMKARYLEVGVEHAGVARSEAWDVLIPLDEVDLDTGTSEVRLGALPSSSITALPRFEGPHVDAEYEARLRAAFHGMERHRDQRR